MNNFISTIINTNLNTKPVANSRCEQNIEKDGEENRI